MPRPAPRLHRLPHRNDYTLIPAPLDLSLPLVAEKADLPAIIVTPSSPSSTRDFSIAFLASPPKPTLRQRMESYKHFNAPSFRFRSIVITLFILFILVCHLVTHRLAMRRPRLEFSVQTGTTQVVDTSMSWFDFRSLFGSEPSVDAVHREFIISETIPGAL